MKPELVIKHVTLRELYWLAAAVVMAILPHSTRIPAWIILLVLALILWRVIGLLKNWPLLNDHSFLLRLIQIVLVIAGFAGVYNQFGTLVGRDAGTSLLVLLIGLKVLETCRERDYYVVIFLGYFIVVTNFFYTQSIATAIYMALTVWVTTSCLITFNDRAHCLPDIARLRIAGTLLLQALPIMLFLFLLFPRINGPLWGLPKDAHAGLIGIDDVMEPGTISQLIQTDAVAFRVEFGGEIPEQSKLYWRGPVLLHSDGRKWTRDVKTTSKSVTLETGGPSVRYTVTMEPNNQRWLFALEMPNQVPEQGYITSDFQLLTREPVRQRIRYDLSSSPEYLIRNSGSAELERALQLPAGYHSKTIALAQSWREEGDNPAQIIDRALRWFSEDEFYYTLTPPLLAQDNVDEFLFNTKQGFCEHYAGAFVILMRAAEIPARVVTGYQGGNYNPVGDYLIVGQQDAHAWAEVWLDERGWVRVDPTSAVSPARVLEGIESALPDAIVDIPLVFSQNPLSRDLWERLRNSWDAINNQWNQWVISYGPQRQSQFLSQFGMGDIDWKAMTAVLSIAISIFLSIIAIWLLRQNMPNRDQARTLYDEFCRKLARRGILRLHSEGPLDFARRVAGRSEDLSAPVNEITRLYISVRYGTQQEYLEQLKARVKDFRPPKTITRKIA
ncbi:MAG: transglutaminase protein [Gammaproteobacteria bacterium]|nr:transglutaminase protein [Gammaproteobacteria bacterium]